MNLDISERSIRRILKVDLGLRSYKKIIEPLLSDNQKKTVCELSSKRKNFRKKLFDIDGIYNSRNERVWTVDRNDADKRENETFHQN